MPGQATDTSIPFGASGSAPQGALTSAKLHEIGIRVVNQGDQTRKEFPPWSDELLIDWLLFRLKIPIVLVPLMTAGVYWGVPLAFSVWDGTLFSSAIASSGADYLSQSGAPQSIIDAAQQFAAYQKIRGPAALPYLQDTTHFLFTIILSIGAAIATITLKNFNTTIAKLVNEGIPHSSDETVAHIYVNYRRRAFLKRYSCLSAALGLAAALLFLHLSGSAQLSYWWGSNQYGMAGDAFAVIIGLMVFAVLQGAIILIFGALMFARQMTLPVELKPFHRDGCNGLAPLGRQIFFLWWNALLGGLAIYVALRLGYLGIERTPIVWALALLGSLTIPAIAIIPLMAALRAVRKVQGAALDRLGTVLNRSLGEADAAIQNGNLPEANRIISELGEVKDLFQTFKNANVWPFNPKALTFILVANAIQIVLTAHELIGLISH